MRKKNNRTYEEIERDRKLWDVIGQYYDIYHANDPDYDLAQNRAQYCDLMFDELNKHLYRLTDFKKTATGTLQDRHLAQLHKRAEKLIKSIDELLDGG